MGQQTAIKGKYMSNQDWIAHAYPLQQITIRLQGTRHSDKAAIIDQLETVLARLKAGAASGNEHDDDFGYDFVYTKAVFGPSFFDEPAGLASQADQTVEEVQRHVQDITERRDSVKRKLEGGSKAVNANDLLRLENALVLAQMRLTALTSNRAHS